MKHYNFDVHGMSKLHLIRYLGNLLEYIPLQTIDVCIIHGYNNGTTLRDYLRKEFSNKRVIEIQNMGAGRTLLRLKTEKEIYHDC